VMMVCECACGRGRAAGTSVTTKGCREAAVETSSNVVDGVDDQSA
jgi:hypothetical protein